MQPTLQPEDLLLVALAVRPRVGDLVVAELPGGRGLGVKRVGLIDDDGVFLERDNPREGSDSWAFGPVPSTAVRGRVIRRLWPNPGSL